MDLFLQAKQVKMMGGLHQLPCDVIGEELPGGRFPCCTGPKHNVTLSFPGCTYTGFSEVNSWITDKRNIANITGIRLIDPTSIEVQNAIQDWIFSERLRGKTINITPNEVKVGAK